MNESDPPPTFYPSPQNTTGRDNARNELESFLRQFFAEQQRPEQFAARWAEIRAASAHHQGPALSVPELEHAGRVAWRNSTRCIGRLFWKSLIVRDMRHLEAEDDIIASLIEHLKVALNGGAIRSVLTVFAPADPAGKGAIRIWNHQLLRYAGYRQADRILGDPSSVEFTEQAIRLGWSKAERSAFDILPWVIQVPGRPPRLVEVPPEVITEVPLSHPQFPWFGKLGLKWYAVPILSDMCLDAAGERFTAAPFNGWYMGTEIGARNLGDASRYNLLPLIAERMGLDIGNHQSLWKDRALIELNQAVLHSFNNRGVKLVDHHTAAQEFMLFAERERAAGRQPAGEWEWLVPPISGSATPVFHNRWNSEILKPTFIAQEKAWKTN